MNRTIVCRNVLAFLLVATALAQSGDSAFRLKDGSTVDHCGLGSKHHCRCIERTSKIQTAAAAICNSPDWRNFYKTQDACFRDKLVGTDHCSIAETPHRYDEGKFEWDASLQEYRGESDMGPMCSMAFKKHDCACDDGPTCHFGHDREDHQK